MKKRMTLGDFTQDLRRDVEAFEAHWMSKRATDPKNWPLSYSGREDWDDQFVAYMETRMEMREEDK